MRIGLLILVIMLLAGPAMAQDAIDFDMPEGWHLVTVEGYGSGVQISPSETVEITEGIPDTVFVSVSTFTDEVMSDDSIDIAIDPEASPAAVAGYIFGLMQISEFLMAGFSGESVDFEVSFELVGEDTVMMFTGASQDMMVIGGRIDGELVLLSAEGPVATIDGERETILAVWESVSIGS